MGWEQCEGLEIPFGAGDQARRLFTAREELQGQKPGDLPAASACQSPADPATAALGRSPRQFARLSWRVPGSGIRKKGRHTAVPTDRSHPNALAAEQTMHVAEIWRSSGLPRQS